MGRQLTEMEEIENRVLRMAAGKLERNPDQLYEDAKRLLELNKSMVIALHFYAHVFKLEVRNKMEGDSLNIIHDNGNIAREALKKQMTWKD